ncbi:MAG: hypothetical protein A2731_02705 [Candidatus Buchananbacteria bacterium RIFCSPHIGHO2_01_FULL_39_8]|uniref:Uncharacterized protein n=1 Tax=Candidatus Buchananbacteria bacterium RIFCSPHIGHO2_01_FULL_39_8 TaxID=1797533 RepID=A0A1G1XT84_9BACT|nr:MAG: hypothetical protein A2731_02705 [Candidatus Buchananbacteria bacterium RIFCSPHIGHO2_01_FULL_39_8]
MPETESSLLEEEQKKSAPDSEQEFLVGEEKGEDKKSSDYLFDELLSEGFKNRRRAEQIEALGETAGGVDDKEKNRQRIQELEERGELAARVPKASEAVIKETEVSQETIGEKEAAPVVNIESYRQAQKEILKQWGESADITNEHQQKMAWYNAFLKLPPDHPLRQQVEARFQEWERLDLEQHQKNWANELNHNEYKTHEALQKGEAFRQILNEVEVDLPGQKQAEVIDLPKRVTVEELLEKPSFEEPINIEEIEKIDPAERMDSYLLGLQTESPAQKRRWRLFRREKKPTEEELDFQFAEARQKFNEHQQFLSDAREYINNLGNNEKAKATAVVNEIESNFKKRESVRSDYLQPPVDISYKDKVDMLNALRNANEILKDRNIEINQALLEVLGRTPAQIEAKERLNSQLEKIRSLIKYREQKLADFRQVGGKLIDVLAKKGWSDDKKSRYELLQQQQEGIAGILREVKDELSTYPEELINQVKDEFKKEKLRQGPEIEEIAA